MNFNYEEVRAFQLEAGDVIRYRGTQNDPPQEKLIQIAKEPA